MHLQTASFHSTLFLSHFQLCFHLRRTERRTELCCWFFFFWIFLFLSFQVHRGNWSQSSTQKEKKKLNRKTVETHKYWTHVNSIRNIYFMCYYSINCSTHISLLSIIVAVVVVVSAKSLKVWHNDLFESMEN